VIRKSKTYLELDVIRLKTFMLAFLHAAYAAASFFVVLVVNITLPPREQVRAASALHSAWLHQVYAFFETYMLFLLKKRVFK